MGTKYRTTPVHVVNSQSPATWLKPDEPLIAADGRDWSWCYVIHGNVPSCQGYKCGTDGSLWSCWRTKGAGYGRACTQVMTSIWKRLKPDVRKRDNRKRYTVRQSNGTYRRAWGGHFVLETFVGPRPAGMECCHWNGDCRDDSLSNVRWDTKKANAADSIRLGVMAAGENHPKTKMSNLDIKAAMEMRRQGMKLKSIGLRFGVSEQRIFQICKKGGR